MKAIEPGAVVEGTEIEKPAASRNGGSSAEGGDGTKRRRRRRRKRGGTGRDGSERSAAQGDESGEARSSEESAERDTGTNGDNGDNGDNGGDTAAADRPARGQSRDTETRAKSDEPRLDRQHIACTSQLNSIKCLEYVKGYTGINLN